MEAKKNRKMTKQFHYNPKSTKDERNQMEWRQKKKNRKMTKQFHYNPKMLDEEGLILCTPKKQTVNYKLSSAVCAAS